MPNGASLGQLESPKESSTIGLPGRDQEEPENRMSHPSFPAESLARDAWVRPFSLLHRLGELQFPELERLSAHATGLSDAACDRLALRGSRSDNNDPRVFRQSHRRVQRPHQAVLDDTRDG